MAWIRLSKWLLGVGTSLGMVLTLPTACSSSSEGNAGNEGTGGEAGDDGDGSFCGALASAYARCAGSSGGGSACADHLAAECNNVVALLNPTILSAATTCVKEASCGSNPLACLGRSIAVAQPTDAQNGLANTFCESCATAPGELCKTAFYGTGSVPGFGIALLPFGDRPIASVTENCTTSPLGKAACQAAFSTCVGATTTRVLAESISAETVKCVLAGINEGLSPSGDGGSSETNACAGCAGCCADGECKSGKDVGACGGGGQACEACADGASCTGGRCVSPCGPGNCTGCCNAAGACVSGTETSNCGTHGAACTTCAGDQACSTGICVAQSCSGTCASGCCSAQGCQPGTSTGACGKGGAACVDCRTGRACSGQACVLDPTSKWDLWVYRLILPARNASGDDWDSFGGLPDAFMQATTISQTATSVTRSNTLQPHWLGNLLNNVPASVLMSQVKVEVWDDDPAFDDHIGICNIAAPAETFDGNFYAIDCPAAPGDVSFQLEYRLQPD